MTPRLVRTGRSRSGKLGGAETLRRHGRKHFRRIGKMGGLARGRSRKRA